MGNVLAAGQSAPPLPLAAPISPTKIAPEPEINMDESNERENPGTIEELHRKCKDIMPTNFEGAKLMIQKGLSSHFQVSHTVNLSSTTPSGYKFGATYVGTKQLSPSEAFPVVLGDIDPSGNLNANVIHQLTPNIRCKFGSQIQENKFVAAQLTTDYRGSDYTASLTLANPDLINDSGVAVAHYLQSVTKNLALGGELAYQYGRAVPGGEIAALTAAVRYQNGLSTWSATAGMVGVHLCYYRKASEQLKFGVEVESNFRVQEAVGTFAYQIDLPKADLVYRGMLDTNWNVGAVLEKRLLPLPFTLAISAHLNHAKHQPRLGIGMIIG